MDETYENLVGGEWVGARSGAWADRRNPADTGELVARYPAMDADDVEHALARAADGYREWRRAGLLARGRVLLDAGARLRDRADGIARDVTREMGKALGEARAEVASAAAFFEYYGGLARGAAGDVLADRRPDVTGWTRREPLGVVALITPWNDPIATPARKLAPALVTGNAVVLKPAEQTPVSAHHLMRALHEAGLPAGAANTVTGPPSSVAGPLLDDDAVAAVSFTGSTTVGLQLGRQLGGRVTRLQTEMGGKNAALVLADADLDAAADTIVAAGCGQAGQRCTATSRVIVEQPVHDAVVERLVERVRGKRVGPGLDEATDVGPLVTETHLESVLAAVDKARGEGATVAVGGGRLDDPPFDRGHFMAPAVLTGVEPDMAIWDEEAFGPVLAVTAAASLDEGIDLVNASRYGLASSLFTTDLRAAHRFAEEVEVGQVGVNLPTTGWDVHVPFGGFKESGSPFKEHGTEGLRFYSRVKSVVIGYA